MSGECHDRSDFVRANAYLLAVTAIFRRQNQLLHEGVVVTLGPAIVAALLQKHQLFRWQRGFLIRLGDIRPIRMQLVSSVLGRKYPASRVDGEAFPIAYPRREALGWRKRLIRFGRVIAPDATTSLQFRARVDAG